MVVLGAGKFHTRSLLLRHHRHTKILVANGSPISQAVEYHAAWRFFMICDSRGKLAVNVVAYIGYGLRLGAIKMMLPDALVANARAYGKARIGYGLTIFGDLHLQFGNRAVSTKC